MNTNFWNGFEKRASEAAFDRSGNESTAIQEETAKYENSNERLSKDVTDPYKRRGGTGGTLQNNVSGAPAGGLV